MDGVVTIWIVPPRIPEEDLLTELKRLAQELDRTPTVHDMSEHGAHSHNTYRTRFGSWNEALEAAGLPKNRNILDEELIKRLREFAAKLGRTPTQKDMDEDGPYSAWVYRERFGSWLKARAEAGFTSEPISPIERVSDAELLAELGRVAAELGRAPT